MENWQPKLIDIEYLAHNGTDSEKEYYSQFGIEQIDWKNYSNIIQNKDEIIELFHGDYDNRMVGLETMELFQHRLQALYNRIAPKYDRAFKMYNDYADRLMEDVGDIVTRTLNENTTDNTGIQGTEKVATGTTSDYGAESKSSASVNDRNDTNVNGDASAMSQMVDTPDSAVNASDIGIAAGYAGTVQKDSSENHSGTVSVTETGTQSESNDNAHTSVSGTSDTTTTENRSSTGMRGLVERTEHSTDLMEQISDNISGWRNLIAEFVYEFRGLFMGVYWF